MGELLSRQDRVYPLSLLVPFAVFNLALKAYDVAARLGGFKAARTFKLMCHNRDEFVRALNYFPKCHPIVPWLRNPKSVTSVIV